MQHMEQVDKYLATEVQLGAMLGPFPTQPFSTCATSPLHTVPKRNSDSRRIVVDLSYPSPTSVNDGIPMDTYEGEPMQLQYKGIDDLIQRMVDLGQGCLLYKADLHRAYRQLRLCPADYFLTGLHWREQWYIDMSIPFGLRTSAMACQRTTDAVNFIFPYFLCNYLDDLAGAEKADTAQRAMDTLLALLNELGLEESVDKRCPPSPVMVFLGIVLNSTTMTMHIPQDKVEEIILLLHTWHT